MFGLFQRDLAHFARIVVVDLEHSNFVAVAAVAVAAIVSLLPFGAAEHCRHYEDLP